MSSWLRPTASRQSTPHAKQLRSPPHGSTRSQESRKPFLRQAVPARPQGWISWNDRRPLARSALAPLPPHSGKCLERRDGLVRPGAGKVERGAGRFVLAQFEEFSVENRGIFTPATRSIPRRSARAGRRVLHPSAIRAGGRTSSSHQFAIRCPASCQARPGRTRGQWHLPQGTHRQDWFAHRRGCAIGSDFRDGPGRARAAGRRVWGEGRGRVPAARRLENMVVDANSSLALPSDDLVRAREQRVAGEDRDVVGPRARRPPRQRGGRHRPNCRRREPLPL